MFFLCDKFFVQRALFRYFSNTSRTFDFFFRQNLTKSKFWKGRAMTTMGVGRKISKGRGSNGKKTKNNTSVFQRGSTEKRPKNSKIDRKIVLLSLYLLYLYHVWKSRRATAPCPRCRRPWWLLLPPDFVTVLYNCRSSGDILWSSRMLELGDVKMICSFSSVFIWLHNQNTWPHFSEGEE